MYKVKILWNRKLINESYYKFKFKENNGIEEEQVDSTLSQGFIIV